MSAQPEPRQSESPVEEREQQRAELLAPAPAVIEDQEPHTDVRGRIVEGDVL